MFRYFTRVVMCLAIDEQVESGAQVIQIFDSWAGHLSPKDYDTLAVPYQVQFSTASVQLLARILCVIVSTPCGYFISVSLHRCAKATGTMIWWGMDRVYKRSGSCYNVGVADEWVMPCPAADHGVPLMGTVEDSRVITSESWVLERSY